MFPRFFCPIQEKESADRQKEASDRREREREERVAASLKERKRQVELARSEQQREVEIGRTHHMKEEAEQSLRALLADLVSRTLLVLRFEVVPRKS